MKAQVIPLIITAAYPLGILLIGYIVGKLHISVSLPWSSAVPWVLWLSLLPGWWKRAWAHLLLPLLTCPRKNPNRMESAMELVPWRSQAVIPQWETFVVL